MVFTSGCKCFIFDTIYALQQVAVDVAAVVCGDRTRLRVGASSEQVECWSTTQDSSSSSTSESSCWRWTCRGRRRQAGAATSAHWAVLHQSTGEINSRQLVTHYVVQSRSVKFVPHITAACPRIHITGPYLTWTCTNSRRIPCFSLFLLPFLSPNLWRQWNVSALRRKLSPKNFHCSGSGRGGLLYQKYCRYIADIDISIGVVKAL